MKAGRKNYWWSSDDVLRMARAKTDTVLDRLAMEVEREAKLSMRKGGGKAHVPSAPGTPPNVQTGNLRSSISWARMGASWVIGPTTQGYYGRYHEHGSRRHPRRPFMRPALDRVRWRYYHLFPGGKLV